MSTGFISFIFSLGVAGFIYSLVANRVGTGGAKTASIAAGIIFVMAYIFLYTLMKYVLHI